MAYHTLKNKRQLIAVTVLFLALLVIFSWLMLDKKERKQKATDPVAAQIRLYQHLVDTALNYRPDAFLKRLDTTLPQPVNNDHRLLAYHAFLKAIKVYKQGKKDSAWIAFGKMLPYADTAKDYDLITLRQTALAQLHLDTGASPVAASMLLSALELQRSHPSRYRWWPAALMAKTWFLKSDYNNAQQYIRLAYNSIPDTNNYSLRAWLLSNYSRIASARKNFRQALSYEDSVVRLAGKAGDSLVIATSLAAQAVLYISMGDTAKGYRLQAEGYKLKERFNAPDLCVEYLNMAATLADKQQYEQSIIYAQKALRLAEKQNDQRSISIAHECFSNAYRGRKQYDSAIYHLRASFNAELRHNTSEQNKAIGSLEANYKLKLQEEQTRDLQRKSAAQQDNVKLQRTVIIVLIILILLVALSAWLYNRARILRAAKDKAEWEQRLLRSQMQPHFIFNTLAAIPGFIRAGDSNKAIRYIHHLAKLMRVALEHSSQPFISLHEEVEALEHYLTLQKMRFETLFTYDIEVYDGYNEDEGKIYIPPMLLQPFVENAIVHGFYDIDYQGEISIKIDKHDELIQCTIDDNGRGLNNPPPRHTHDKSYATAIIKRHLKLLGRKLGKKAEMQMADHSDIGGGTGTRVVVTIPFLDLWNKQRIATTAR